MSCVTWLGRIVTRIFVTGFHPPAALGEHYLAAIIPAERFIRRQISTQVAISATTSIASSTSLPSPEDLRVTPASNKEQIKKETSKEVFRAATSAQICRSLQNKWQDYHLGPGFVSVVSGLPKDFTGSRFRKGQFGDDAWFIAGNNNADVIGVADGVGGWRNYGLDPGEFSFTLMQACERLVEGGFFVPSKPEGLLATGYSHLRRQKEVKGSSTACLVVLSRADSVLYCANLGDSGFVVLRDGKVLHRSKEQTHGFNTPYQLACPPPGEVGLCDSPDSADTSQLDVKDGDVILLATDGVFDNLPETMLVAELIKIQGEKDPLHLQSAANAIVLMARTIAFDSKYMSPFARNAQRNGFNAIGGKPDDITVLLATVSMDK